MTSSVMRPLGEVVRDEMAARERIAEALSSGPKTIPEIAAAIGEPGWEVTLWVMAMRRYGTIEELPKPKADDYFRYTLGEVRS
jgi:hypothetical protein